MHRLGAKAAYRLLLTGAPVTNKAIDILSQYKFPNPAVFGSSFYSWRNFEQAKARIHRAGQKQPCTYIFLTAKNTIDEKVLQILREKADLAKTLVDDYRKGVNPFA
jgi:SNF2 family DNA or RNA helicase